VTSIKWWLSIYEVTWRFFVNERPQMKAPNEITEANAGGPRLFSVGTLSATPIAQYNR
jgi:hypothetical protein